MANRGLRVTCALIIGALLCTPSSSGAVDLTNLYLMRVGANFYHCLLSLTQSGTDLAMSGDCDTIGDVSASGTVDVGSGVFTLSGQAQSHCSAPGSLTIDATGDGTTFSGTGTCAGLITAPVFGSTCGNGILDAGEQCDDGNQENGDCCSALCGYEPPGSLCWEVSGNECVTSGDGTCLFGTCTHPPVLNGTPCLPDSNSCTADVCNGGNCVHPVVNAGTECADDGDVCTDDVCDGGGTCLHSPNTAPCEDGNGCTKDDTCSGGTCMSGTPLAQGAPCSNGDLCTTGTCDASTTCVPGGPVTCDACSDACLPDYGCVALDIPECSGAPIEPSAKLTVQSRVPDDKDATTWSWGKGQATAIADFGDPVSSTNYRFCAYAFRDVYVCGLGCGLPVYQTLAIADMPAGGGWTTVPKGFKYKGAATKALLKSGDAGKARLIVKGKGASLAVPASLADYHEPAIVQLRGDGGRCWGAQFDSFSRHTSQLLKMKDGH